MNFTKREIFIILIAGKAQSGKNVVAKYLQKEYQQKNKEVIISPYTKYLKRYIQEITGIPVTEKRKPRDLLQQISSKLIKEKLKQPNFFIRRQIEDIMIYSYFKDIIIVPDVRFPEEITAIKKQFPNVVSIQVNRKNYQSTLTKLQQQDITETALDHYQQFDYVIENTTKKELKQQIQTILKQISESREDHE